MKTKASADTYRRGQAEYALWQYMTFNHQASMTPPPIFLTRIKRLLDLDRAQGKMVPSRRSLKMFAFVDGLPGVRGTDVGFTAFHVVCLAIGLDLLDIGFKQSEIVFLLQHLRPVLKTHFTCIQKSPPVPRQVLTACDRPGCPTYTERGIECADCRVFMIIHKVEVTEVFPAPIRGKTPGEESFMFHPTFCYGIEALHKVLHQMPYPYRKAVVVEIADTVALITEFLQKAPLVKRGQR